MRRLEIRLFGNIDVRWEGAPAVAFPTRLSRSLFVYLALHRDRMFTREHLQDLFWRASPSSVARKALRTCLWRVRNAIDTPRHGQDSVLRAEGDAVGMTLADHAWLDVEHFEFGLKGVSRSLAQPRPRAEDVEAAILLYRGDFAEELHDEWCLFERERLRIEYLNALEFLLEAACAQAQCGEVARWGRAILARDPLREHVHRTLMRCHYAMGDRPLAILQFQRCAATLRNELGIAPMRETLQLFELVENEQLVVPPQDLSDKRAEWKGDIPPPHGA